MYNIKFDFVVHLLEINNQSLRHAITSLVSVLSSTLRGVEYLTYSGNMVIVEKIIRVTYLSYVKILKE